MTRTTHAAVAINNTPIRPPVYTIHDVAGNALSCVKPSVIATINESLQIADAGKAKRAAAEVELLKMEQELKDTLAAAKAKQTGLGDTVGGAAGV